MTQHHSKQATQPNLLRLATATLSVAASVFFTPVVVHAEVYLSGNEAKQLLVGQQKLQRVTVTLSKAQRNAIRKASKTRVNSPTLKAWKTASGGWFIIDQVVGKHEMIDIAVALTKDGKVSGIEILQYRETYGYEVKNKKWLKQFLGKGHQEHLKLDKQIKNISGATLSCRHITDGINRLTHTWDQVLRHL